MVFKKSFLFLFVVCFINQVFGDASFEVSKKRESNFKTDVIAFTYDRPLQFFAFLESVYNYLDNVNDIVVIYRVSNDAFDDGYEKVKKSFPDVVFYKQDTDEPYDQFKDMLLDVMKNKTSGDYVLFGVDDNIATDYIDLKECAHLIDETGAYGFFFRLGKNITQCYTLGIHDNFKLPPLEEVKPGIFSWIFEDGLYDWDYQNSVDFNLFKKKEILGDLEEMTFYTPNSLEAVWCRNRDRTRRGLCFEHSKMVNIPLNIVQESKIDRNMGVFLTEELLEEFNLGFKFDIDSLYQFDNRAPQVHYIPEFTCR